MNHETVWTIERPKKESFPDGAEKDRRNPDGPAREPALAFSLSLLIWGAGQLYNRRWKHGILFLLLMANFIAILRLILGNLNSILRNGESIGIGASGILTAWCFFHLSGILLWIGNAVQAYREASARHGGAFQGVGSPLWPSLGSMVIPGWGQFLNGQPIKGIFFLSIFGVFVFSLPTILLILLFWPGFQTGSERLFWEEFLLVLAGLAGSAILIWPFVILDAVKVGRDEVKKEPIRKRFEYANNLRRMKGWVGAYFPQAKLTLMLALILTFCLAYSYHYFPKKFYLTGMRQVEAGLSQRDMVLIPRIIDRVIKRADPGGRR